MVLYGPCCKSDSGHHYADFIYHHHYMEMLHPFQDEKQEQDEEPLLDYFAILSAQHFWMELVHNTTIGETRGGGGVSIACQKWDL